MKGITVFLNLYPVWIIGSSLAGFLYPPLFAWFSGNWMVAALIIVMLGMGITLEVGDFKKIFSMPAILLLGALIQYTIMPLCGWLIAKLAGLETSLAVGLILVSCCPGGTASNVIAYLAKANLALSILMTTVSTLLAIIATPLLCERQERMSLWIRWGCFKQLSRLFSYL
ncbi:MAG: bile acid:sodium symporter [Tannerellaceae bacterium]|nr:bile acid:sodium symporter [Tannerellaceae bacterium]